MTMGLHHCHSYYWASLIVGLIMRLQQSEFHKSSQYFLKLHSVFSCLLATEAGATNTQNTSAKILQLSNPQRKKDTSKFPLRTSGVNKLIYD